MPTKTIKTRAQDIPSKRSKKKGWIEWLGSRARAILIEDLEPGGILFGQDHLSADDLFTFYSELDEFKMVVFPQFKERLNDHRKQGTGMKQMAQRDKKAMDQDMKSVGGRKLKNHRNEPVFDLMPAKELLRKDVQDKKHTKMTLKMLWLSNKEYQEIKSLKKFKERVYQEIRRAKWMYYLATKRAKSNPAPPRNREEFRKKFATGFDARKKNEGAKSNSNKRGTKRQQQSNKGDQKSKKAK